ncbi:hypothetical protein Trisim1_005961 [Trichoderma cf. simile WF8]
MDKYGQTPLSWAVRNRHKQIVELLLATDGVDPDVQDEDGRTPLSWATDEGAVKLLNSKNKPIVSAIKQPFTFRRGSKQVLQPGEPSGKIVGEGFPEFERQLSSLAKLTQMELKMNWEVPEAMQLYRKGIQFSTILTISGSETDAQAAICEDYVLEHFPKTGEILLAYVQAAWDSEENLYNGDGEASGILDKVSVRFEHLQGSKHQTASVTASGMSNDLTELARAFTWLSCAIRPAKSGNLCLSTFQFSLYTKRDSTDCVVIEVQLLPLREANNGRSCWCDLFTKAIIVSDAPISDRSRFRESKGNRRDLSIPKGLDIPFDIMVNLAAVDYPFEYENGIVLKGSATLLAATATWQTHAGTAFQWHMVSGGKNGISLSDYTDRYQIYQGEGQSASFELETVRKATRTFLGWCGSYLIQLANVDPAAVEIFERSQIPRNDYQIPYISDSFI